MPAHGGSFSVKGATFSLQLEDGRAAVVNCDSKFAERMAGRAGNHRNCRTPLVDEVQVEFSGDDAKLIWPVSIDRPWAASPRPRGPRLELRPSNWPDSSGTCTNAGGDFHRLRVPFQQ
jgi:hypothetical protein